MKTDKIIVIDLESTCWENQSEGTPEIIEIGIAEIDTFPVSCESILARPEKSHISEYCTQLTGWTWKELKKTAMPLESAFNKLVKDHGTRSRFTLAFGDDCDVISKICQEKGYKNPLNKTLNISDLILLKYGRKFSLEQSLRFFGLNYIGKPHLGKDDAYNAACLAERLLFTIW